MFSRCSTKTNAAELSACDTSQAIWLVLAWL